MRLPLMSLSLAVVAACSFQPGGDGSSQDAPIDARDDIDACVPVDETCEGTDQDCDGMIDEGFATGDACDGPDTDVCPDDATICNRQGVVVCGDTSGDDDAELCNGADDDCDGDADEDFAVGQGCDGEDGDACLEGTFACAPDGAGVVCGDTTGTIVEICDGNDEDCDGTPDDGFNLQQDMANCGECGNACTNTLGTTSCMGATCRPVCTNGAANCDGEPDNGCELQDTNPSCNVLAAVDLTVNADVNDSASTTGTTERVVRVRLRESTGMGGNNLTARLALTSGSGARYTLAVHCPTCGTPLTDPQSSVSVGRDDIQGVDRSFDVFAEIRYDASMPSTTCAAWTLTVTGNTGSTNRCAN